MLTPGQLDEFVKELIETKRKQTCISAYCSVLSVRIGSRLGDIGFHPAKDNHDILSKITAEEVYKLIPEDDIAFKYRDEISLEIVKHLEAAFEIYQEVKEAGL